MKPKPLFALRRVTFPNPEHAMSDGLMDVSDDLTVERLFEAYSFGIFPWPQSDLPVLWFSPEDRGVLDFKKFHVPRSLAKLIKKSPWTWSINRAFSQVIKQCAAQPRPGQSGTWITPEMVQVYVDFHKLGYAHSFEIWEQNRLVGGLYGVSVGGAFCGESMFHLKTGASKVALVQAVAFLRERGVAWMDIQMVTPLLEQMGGEYVSRREYLKRLEASKKSAADIFSSAKSEMHSLVSM